jgi:hypothetical protein
MPFGIPPKSGPRPRFLPLAPGETLWAVTGHAADPFRPPPTEPEMQGERWGGRFDPTPDCAYPYCYAALDDLTALSETLLRDVPQHAPPRYLPRHAVAGRSLTLLETRRELWLVSLLDGPDLAAVRQDSWLVHAEVRDFARTQLWGHWLRDSTAPDGTAPAGIVWPSRRHPVGRAVLLFGDRCADAVSRSPHGARRLDDDGGRSWVNLRLAQLSTRLAGAV